MSRLQLKNPHQESQEGALITCRVATKGGGKERGNMSVVFHEQLLENQEGLTRFPQLKEGPNPTHTATTHRLRPIQVRGDTEKLHLPAWKGRAVTLCKRCKEFHLLQAGSGYRSAAQPETLSILFVKEQKRLQSVDATDRRGLKEAEYPGYPSRAQLSPETAAPRPNNSVLRESSRPLPKPIAKSPQIARLPHRIVRVLAVQRRPDRVGPFGPTSCRLLFHCDVLRGKARPGPIHHLLVALLQIPDKTRGVKQGV
jgi:hypothetical protein